MSNQLDSLDEVLVQRPIQTGELRGVLNVLWAARVASPDLDTKSIAEKIRNRLVVKTKRESAQSGAPNPNVPQKVTV